MIHTPPVDRFCARLSRFSSELSASAPVAAGFSSFANWQASRVAGLRRSAGRLSSRTEQGRRLLRTRHTRVVPTFTGWKIPESGIPPSDRATRRYTKVHLDVCLRLILHADWSNRPRTAFRRWTQAVHEVAAIQVGRHRFLACPYRFLAANRQAKAGLSSGHSHDRTAFESFAPDISEQLDPNLTDLFDTRNHGSQRLSASYQHTRHVDVTRTHAHTTRDKGTKALTVPRRPPVRAAR